MAGNSVSGKLSGAQIPVFRIEKILCDGFGVFLFQYVETVKRFVPFCDGSAAWNDIVSGYGKRGQVAIDLVPAFMTGIHHIV